jgi:hypothetical protein
MTAPPRGGPITHTGHGAGAAAANDAVQMSLGDQGEAALTVLPATTDTNGQKLSATRVTLKVANPGRDIAPIPVPMSMRDGVWVANCRFPFPGTSGHLAPINLMPTVGAGVSDISHVQSGVPYSATGCSCAVVSPPHRLRLFIHPDWTNWIAATPSE